MKRRLPRWWPLAPVRMVVLTVGAIVLAAAIWRGLSGAGQARAVHATYDPKTGKLTRIDYDADGDGRIETWAYMNGTVVLRIEIDKNEDGRLDRWEYYTPDQKLQKVGISRADNGRPDEWMYEDHGRLVRVETDNDGDGRVDQWEQYEDGHVASVAFDTTGRGRPDRRLVYGPDGSLAGVDVDPTGSGHWQKADMDHAH